MSTLGIDPLPRSQTSSSLGPSTRALFATYQNLIGRVGELERQARAGLWRLAALKAIDPDLERFLAPTIGVPADLLISHADATRELGRLAGELQSHRDLAQGVATGRFAVRPSQSKPYDLDVGQAEADDPQFAGELGFLPILLGGLAVLARLALVGGAMVLTSRAIDHMEFRWKAKLVEAGKDISKLSEPAPDLSTKVSRVTTPIAFAAGAVAAAVLVSSWKKRKA